MTKKQPDWVSQGVSAYVTGDASENIDNWSGNIVDSINAANKDVQSVADTWGNNTVESMGGFYAEAHHAGSFNINAAIKNSEDRAQWIKPGGPDAKAAADIRTSWGEDYSSKYHRTPESSFMEQAKASKEAGYTNSQYKGQERLIPSDQVEQAQNYADRRIAKDIDNRPDVAERLQETKDQLTGNVKNPEGIKSDSLSKSDSDQWARDVKKGEVGQFSYNDSVNVMTHVKEIGQAAGTAALISVAIQSAPTIVGGFKRALTEENYSFSEYGGDVKKWTKEHGIAIGADAFVKGAIAGSLSAAIKSGNLGQTSLGPAPVAGIAVVSVESAKALWRWDKGELSGEQAASETFKAGLRTSAALAGKVAGQALIPIPIVGAVVGSFIATFVIDKGINSIENPLSLEMLRIIDDSFYTQRQVLSKIFDINTNYQSIVIEYENVIRNNYKILVQKENNIKNKEEVIKQLEKRNQILRGKK